MLAGVAIVAAGCATGSGTRTETLDALPPVTYPFRPAHLISPVTLAQGRYANLYAPSSYGVLVNADTLQRKADEAARAGAADPITVDTANPYDQHFWVIELHLESAFPDTSIAYDVVGLRNMSVALVTPDGEHLTPLQRIPGSSASEEPVGALRQFGRTNIIIFPKRDLVSGNAWLGPNAPALRLVIEGFHSEYVLAWNALPPDVPEPEIPEPEMRQVLRNTLVEFYDDLRTMMRMAQ